MKYEYLFQPLQINQLTVRNRIMSTAHAEVYAEHNLTTERYVRYYEEKAKGASGWLSAGVPHRCPAINLSNGGRRLISRMTVVFRISQIWRRPCIATAPKS